MKILFVDDEYDRALPIVDYLQLKDHEVALKPVVLDAFNYFQAHKAQLDIIILDIMMPIFESDMVLFDSNYNVIESYSTGISLYDKFTSEMPAMRNIPIVILSARTDILKVRPDFADLRAENKIAILEKPISMDELAHALTHIHHRSKKNH